MAAVGLAGVPQTDGREQFRLELAAAARRSTFVFGKAVAGHADLDPSLHGFMSAWIERPSVIAGQPVRKLGLAPRWHLKTSLWTIDDKLRRATVDPNIRILLINEVATNSQKWIGRMQKVVLSDTYRWLFPELVPDPKDVRWNATQLELVRTVHHVEPTMESIGSGGASTSNHYNLVDEDDLVGEAARHSQIEMQRGIDQHKLAENLLNDPDRDEIHTVGTRWGVNDVAAWMLEHELPWLDYLKLAIVGAEGLPVWPARVSPATLERLKVRFGPALYSLQFMNEAIASGVTEFDTAKLRHYDVIIRRDDNGVEHRLLRLDKPPSEGGQKLIPLEACTKFQVTDAGISPQDDADRTANVVVAITPQGDDALAEPFDIVLLSATAARTPPRKTVYDAHAVYSDFDPSVWAIETVSAHRVFFDWIVTQFPKARIRQLKTDTRKSKQTRIREFYPFVEQGRFYIPRGGSTFEFVKEFESFPNGITVDLLDALAYTPQIWFPPAKPKDAWQQWVEDFDGRRRAPRESDYDAGRSEITGY